MKIAIPCENGEVMQHFGHAKEFAIYAIEDIKPIEKETVTFDEVDHETVARGLKSRGVDLIICGEIGAGDKDNVVAFLYPVLQNIEFNVHRRKNLPLGERCRGLRDPR